MKTFLVQIILTMLVGAALGLSSAFLAVDKGIGFEGVRIGAWSAWPRAGEKDADPYTRANIARSGELPLAGAAGITFTATTDDDGKRLDGHCDYRISGQMPSAQWWTLTAYNDVSGQLAFNAVQRYGLNSGEILYRTGGTFDIIISPRARSGNWLPIGEVGPMRLLIRLYDTPIATGKSFRDIKMPAINRLDCRS